MKTKIECILPVVFLILGAPLAARATTVTTRYEFITDQSTVVWYWGRTGDAIPHSVEGGFQLSIDFDVGIAWFENVDAILTNGQPPPRHPNANLNGQRLNDLFALNELLSTIVSDSMISFEGHFDPGIVVLVELTFGPDSLYITGSQEYDHIVYDASTFRLEGVAVPEPTGVCLVGLGLLIIRKQTFPAHKKFR